MEAHGWVGRTGKGLDLDANISLALWEIEMDGHTWMGMRWMGTARLSEVQRSAASLPAFPPSVETRY